MRPHSIAAEINKAKGDVDQMRVELRALMEAASESNDEQEQGAALPLAGCLLFDGGDLNAAVPLLSGKSAAAGPPEVSSAARAVISFARAPRGPRRRHRLQSRSRAWGPPLICAVSCLLALKRGATVWSRPGAPTIITPWL